MNGRGENEEVSPIFQFVRNAINGLKFHDDRDCNFFDTSKGDKIMGAMANYFLIHLSKYIYIAWFLATFASARCFSSFFSQKRIGKLCRKKRDGHFSLFHSRI